MSIMKGSHSQIFVRFPWRVSGGGYVCEIVCHNNFMFRLKNVSSKVNFLNSLSIKKGNNLSQFVTEYFKMILNSNEESRQLEIIDPEFHECFDK